MKKEITNGVEHFITTINGRKCKYLPTSYYIESDTTAYHNIHLTPKEHFAKQLGFCKDGLAWYWNEIKQYDKIINRIMKSINVKGKIVTDIWLKRIAKSQDDLGKFDKLIGLFNDDRNSSDTEYLSEDDLLCIIKKAISRAVLPYRKNARAVKKLIKLYN
jgi:hypothetical protein